MIEKIGAAGALIVAVWGLGVGIDHAGGGRIVRSGANGGDREGVLTPETPIDLDQAVLRRGIKHTALVSLAVPKVASIDPGSVQITTPGYSLDDVRINPVVEFRPETNPKPRSVLLLLDNSRSMVMSDGNLPASDPEYRRLEASRVLLASLPPTDLTSLACFPCRQSVDDQIRQTRATKPYELLAQSTRPETAELRVDALREEENGSTPLYRAVEAGAATLEKSPAGRRRVMVLLTDGRDTDDDPDGLARVSAAVKRAGVEMYAVGLGQGADGDVLRQMTPHVLRADDAGALGRSFRQILQQMSREVVQVDLDVVVGRTGQKIPAGRKIEIQFRSNGRLYTTRGVTK